MSRDVVGLTLITNYLAQGRIGIDWKILEHGDGCSIQVIYGGDENVKFANQGVIVGQSAIGFFVARQKTRVELAVMVSSAIILFFLFLKFYTNVKRRLLKKELAEKLFDRALIIEACITTIYASVCSYIFILFLWTYSQTPNPPFAF